MIPKYLYTLPTSLQSPMTEKLQTNHQHEAKPTGISQNPNAEIAYDIGMTSIFAGYTAFYGNVGAKSGCFSPMTDACLQSRLGVIFAVTLMGGATLLGANKTISDLAAYPNIPERSPPNETFWRPGM